MTVHVTVRKNKLQVSFHFPVKILFLPAKKYSIALIRPIVFFYSFTHIGHGILSYYLFCWLDNESAPVFGFEKPSSSAARGRENDRSETNNAFFAHKLLFVYTVA